MQFNFLFKLRVRGYESRVVLLGWPLLLALGLASLPNECTGYEVAAPEFTPRRGFYQGAIEVEMASPTPGASIYYTLDGSEPTSSGGKRYVGKMLVSGASRKAVVTMLARAYKDGYSPSPVAASTYIFLDHVPSQPPDPDGFPSGWGSAPAADYEMDPEVVGHPLYKGILRDSLLQVPSVSLVCDVDDLFGASGIYSNPLEHGDEFERSASAELMYPDGREGFQVNCGVRIIGSMSRDPIMTPKHSFRLVFQDEYGPTKLRFPLFPDTHVTSFDEIILRVEMSNSWLHRHTSQRNKAQYCRDQWMRDSHLAMGRPAGHGSFVHLYLNGLYWGLYNLMERPSSPFMAAYFGGENEDYDVLNAADVNEGDKVVWDAMMSLANAGLETDDKYKAIQKYLDVPSLIDYMVLNLYAATGDWPLHNWYACRRRAPGETFKFFSWDAERCLESLETDRTYVDNDDTPARLYDKLRDNAEFRLLFADHVRKHMFHGGALTVEKCLERWRARSGGIDEAVVAESARWGDYRRDVHQYESGPYELYTRDVFWTPENRRLLEEYFPQRTRVVLDQFRAAGLYPRVDAPEFSRQGGPIASGFSLEMSAPGDGVIYYTVDGTDPRAYGSGAVSKGARVYRGGVVLVGHTVVKARVLSGSTWSALTEAVFTLPSDASGLLITEVMYNPLGGKPYEFLEVKNGGSSVADLSGMYLSGGLSYVFPEKTYLAPGAFLVLVDDAATFRGRYPDVPVSGVFSGSLDNAGEKVELKDKDGVVRTWVDYDDEGFWPIGPDGFGPSLVLVEAGGRGDDPGRWRASAEVNGSPGAEDPEPEHGGVVIHEVLTEAESPLEDAIELKNVTARDVSIGGWYLSDSREGEAELRKFRVPDGTLIPAGEYVVFYENQFNPNPGSWPSFELGGDGGAVYLAGVRAGGELSGYIVGHEFEGSESGVSLGRYMTSIGPDFTAMDGRSFGKDDPASVEEFRSGGGAANGGARNGPVVLNEILYNSGEGGDAFLELYNRTESEVRLHEGGRGWRIRGIRNEEDTDEFEFQSGVAIPPKGYLVVAGIGADEFRSKHGVPAEAVVVGPFGGGLDNGGERIQLLEPKGDAAFVEVDHVVYGDSDPWPAEADGGGGSLERTSPDAYGNDPSSWAASSVSGGSPGKENTRKVENQPPVASFSVDPDRGIAPLDLQVNASDSFDPDGRLVSLEWDFGDGARGEGVAASHRYDLPGQYTVSLAVKDDRGGGAAVTRAVVVEAPGGGDDEADGVTFEEMVRFVSAAVGRAPPAPATPLGQRRYVVAAGNAAVLSGKMKCAVKGVGKVGGAGQVLLAFGPMDVLDDEGKVVVSLGADRFLAMDDGDRVLRGWYAYDGRAVVSLSPEEGDLRVLLSGVMAGGVSADEIVPRSLRLVGKLKASPRGDTCKLAVKTSFHVPRTVNGRSLLLGGAFGFGGWGGMMR